MALAGNSMLSKKSVLKSMRNMPDEFELEDAIDRLILLHKVEKAEKDIQAGKGYTTDQARKKLKKWLK